ncbi:hypothetical protein F1D05_34045 [Kribbella qitaiheensis]|uniref:Uncharacterized protein n=1 Tax=Kribbella qitaiheensis TaxID=1544730 RepID=A0A7G6X711_9ACTN|nr:hypothetical protein [Kribbella qitaiheensis]QNE22026.1 hypothetical protein F1D05_34045 [Kribbella qitaiheensis]
MSSTMEETSQQALASRFSWVGVARRLPIVALLLVIGTGLGYLASAQQPATYTATATVLVEPGRRQPVRARHPRPEPREPRHRGSAGQL